MCLWGNVTSPVPPEDRPNAKENKGFPVSNDFCARLGMIPPHRVRTWVLIIELVVRVPQSLRFSLIQVYRQSPIKINGAQ